jgi:prevent-host-death family protein
MRRFGLREANQHFASLVRAVRRGEEVVLLDRGRPIALVRPLTEPGTAVERLIAKGLLLPAQKPDPLPPFRPIRMKGGLSKAVLSERNERD